MIPWSQSPPVMQVLRGPPAYDPNEEVDNEVVSNVALIQTCSAERGSGYTREKREDRTAPGAPLCSPFESDPMVWSRSAYVSDFRLCGWP